MSDIYQYIDYHRWLAVAFKQKKIETPSFSHRFVAQRLGLKSSGYVLYVMQGKRKLTETMAVGIAQIFRLTKAETEYLLQLIRYNHAKSSREKQFQFERLVAQRRRQVKTLEAEQYRFYEKWYYPAVREALALYPFTGDYRELAEMIVPSITPAEARAAVDLLVELGLAERGSDGVYAKTDAVISTGGVWQSAIIHAHQRELIGMGADALDTFEKAEREISHLTITASPATLGLISQRLAQLRSEILELARSEQHPDRVLQCNFMVFPTVIKKDGQQ